MHVNTQTVLLHWKETKNSDNDALSSGKTPMKQMLPSNDIWAAMCECICVDSNISAVNNERQVQGQP